MTDLSNELIAEIKHIESIASTVVGLGGPAESTARELQKKVRAVIDKIEGTEPVEKTYPPLVAPAKPAAK